MSESGASWEDHLLREWKKKDTDAEVNGQNYGKGKGTDECFQLVMPALGGEKTMGKRAENAKT